MPSIDPPRFLVTAGNTRERIDDVRDWGNIFTGNTGLSIARALAAIGDVDLLTSNREHLAELAKEESGRIHAEGFGDHQHLRELLAQRMAQAERYAGVFMTAAVADYRPMGAFEVEHRRVDPATGHEVWTVKNVQAGKVKGSYREVAFLGQPTEKLVDLFRSEWKFTGLLVKFKLEVGASKEDLIRVGQASRIASGADYLVANELSMVTGPAAGAFLLSDHGERWIARGDLPRTLAEIAQAPIANRKSE